MLEDVLAVLTTHPKLPGNPGVGRPGAHLLADSYGAGTGGRVTRALVVRPERGGMPAPARAPAGGHAQPLLVLHADLPCSMPGICRRVLAARAAWPLVVGLRTAMPPAPIAVFDLCDTCHRSVLAWTVARAISWAAQAGERACCSGPGSADVDEAQDLALLLARTGRRHSQQRNDGGPAGRDGTGRQDRVALASLVDMTQLEIQKRYFDCCIGRRCSRDLLAGRASVRNRHWPWRRSPTRRRWRPWRANCGIAVSTTW